MNVLLYTFLMLHRNAAFCSALISNVAQKNGNSITRGGRFYRATVTQCIDHESKQTANHLFASIIFTRIDFHLGISPFVSVTIQNVTVGRKCLKHDEITFPFARGTFYHLLFFHREKRFSQSRYEWARAWSSLRRGS